MLDDTVYLKLKEIIKPYLPEDVDPNLIEADSHLVHDLNINSTHLVDIVLDVEDTFDITIEDTELVQMDTVSQAISLINSKISKS